MITRVFALCFFLKSEMGIRNEPPSVFYLLGCIMCSTSFSHEWDYTMLHVNHEWNALCQHLKLFVSFTFKCDSSLTPSNSRNTGGTRVFGFWVWVWFLCLKVVHVVKRYVDEQRLSHATTWNTHWTALETNHTVWTVKFGATLNFPHSSPLT